MKEIGGYIELDQYILPMLHEGAIALNCGRNCLAYLIRAKGIKKICLPYFLCDSVKNLCSKEQVQVSYYSIDAQFMPKDLSLEKDEWLYLVNYYGQMSNSKIEKFLAKHGRIIVDNAQAYFQPPLPKTDTIYTCRKFFGVPDGAFLYTDAALDEELPQDKSFHRMKFLLGRFECTASEFYGEYASNNQLFTDEPIKRMSKLTNNLLHGIDYGKCKKRRSDNFQYLHEQLNRINLLHIHSVEGAFAYPLLLKNGAETRKRLIQSNVYVPTLWPNVLKDVSEGRIEYNFALDILPLPCDQRYTREDMQYLIEILGKSI